MIPYEVLLTIGTGCVALFSHAIAMVWRISKAEANLYSKIADIEKDLEHKIQAVRHEITEAKLEASELYMRRDAFRDVMSNIESRLIRLEGKLDAVIAKSS